MSKDTSDPAFPVIGFSNRNGQGLDQVFYGGMSLRDYFAGQALTGICADVCDHFGDPTKEKVAELSYILADAMLKAREEK